MAELRVLETRTEEVRKDVVATIREVLAEAEAGKIKAVAIAVVNSDGSTASSWSQSDVFAALAGAITRLQHRLQVRADDA